MNVCDCEDHPDWPERCSPTRGSFNCTGKYIMPKIPSEMVCIRLIERLIKEAENENILRH